MYISGALNTIAEACGKRFSGLSSDFEQAKVFDFIKGEIGSDFALKSDFDSYSTAFVRTVGTTLNKDEFIKTETVAIDGMIAEAFDGISGHVRIIKEIRGLIVINKSDIDIFSHFFNKYFHKQNDVLVRIVYAHDLIKYKCYIDGGTWQHQPDKEKKTQYSRNKDTMTKVGRPGAEPKPVIDLISEAKIEKCFKQKFIDLLKAEFIDSTPKVFSLMVKAMKEEGILKPSDNIVYYEAFEAYFGKKYGTTEAKNKTLRAKYEKDDLLPYKKQIGNIINKSKTI